MAMWRLAEQGENWWDAVNAILKRDAGTPGFGTRIQWTDYDGNVLNRQTGEVTGTSEPTLTIENGAGEHLLIRKSTDSSTVFEVQDSGVTLTSLNMTGSLDVDGALTVDGNTTLGNANTDTTLIKGPLTIQDWDVVLSGDDLVFQDDNDQEIFRLGDTSSTWHAKVTGPFWATGDIQTGGNLLINSSGYLSIGSSAVSTGGSAIRTAKSASWYARNAADSGNIQIVLVDGSDNIVFGATSGVGSCYLAGTTTYLYGGSSERMRVNSTGISFFGGTPIAKPTLAAAATDLASAITLANSIRSQLQNFNLCS